MSPTRRLLPISLIFLVSIGASGERCTASIHLSTGRQGVDAGPALDDNLADDQTASLTVTERLMRESGMDRMSAEERDQILSETFNKIHQSSQSPAMDQLHYLENNATDGTIMLPGGGSYSVSHSKEATFVTSYESNGSTIYKRSCLKDRSGCTVDYYALDGTIKASFSSNKDGPTVQKWNNDGNDTFEKIERYTRTDAGTTIETYTVELIDGHRVERLTGTRTISPKTMSLKKKTERESPDRSAESYDHACPSDEEILSRFPLQADELNVARVGNIFALKSDPQRGGCGEFAAEVADSINNTLAAFTETMHHFHPGIESDLKEITNGHSPPILAICRACPTDNRLEWTIPSGTIVDGHPPLTITTNEGKHLPSIIMIDLQLVSVLGKLGHISSIRNIFAHELIHATNRTGTPSHEGLEANRFDEVYSCARVSTSDVSWIDENVFLSDAVAPTGKDISEAATSHRIWNGACADCMLDHIRKTGANPLEEARLAYCGFDVDYREGGCDCYEFCHTTEPITIGRPPKRCLQESFTTCNLTEAFSRSPSTFLNRHKGRPALFVQENYCESSRYASYKVVCATDCGPYQGDVCTEATAALEFVRVPSMGAIVARPEEPYNRYVSSVIKQDDTLDASTCEEMSSYSWNSPSF